MSQILQDRNEVCIRCGDILREYHSCEKICFNCGLTLDCTD